MVKVISRVSQIPHIMFRAVPQTWSDAMGPIQDAMGYAGSPPKKQREVTALQEKAELLVTYHKLRCACGGSPLHDK